MTEQEPEEQENESVVEEGPADKQARDRSTIKFPYIDLEAAAELPTAIHNKYGFKCTVEQCAAVTGHQAARSGAFMRKIAAAQVFGLVERDGGDVKLTDLGKLYVEPETVAHAKAKAFLEVELYGKLFNLFKGRSLPGELGIENTMKELGVAPKQADVARQVFRKSADQAGFFAFGKDKLVEPMELGSSVPPKPNGGRGAESQDETSQLMERIRELETKLEAKGTGGAPQSLPQNLPPAITGVLTTLPQDGDVWDEADLNDWADMFKRVVKRAYADQIKGKNPTDASGPQ